MIGSVFDSCFDRSKEALARARGIIQSDWFIERHAKQHRSAERRNKNAP
jgi:hypothetical protein